MSLGAKKEPCNDEPKGYDKCWDKSFINYFIGKYNCTPFFLEPGVSDDTHLPHIEATFY